MKKFNILIIFLLFNLSAELFAQDRMDSIGTKLEELSSTSSGLNNKVELSVDNVSIQDFIHGLAETHNLNMSVDVNLTTQISNTFSNVTVKEVLIFLCRKFNLNISFIGSIMSISQNLIIPEQPAVYIPKKLIIDYNKSTHLLSFDLTNDTLVQVAKELTKKTGYNFVYTPDLTNILLSGFIQSMQFGSALDKLGYANNLSIQISEDSVIQIQRVDKEVDKQKTNSTEKSRKNQTGLNIQANDISDISVSCSSSSISEIISSVFSDLKMNFFIFSDLKTLATLSITHLSLNDFLKYLLNGTDYTYKYESGIYLIGDRNLEGLRETKVVTMNNRTVDKVEDLIPAELKKNVDLKTFADINSIILSGSSPRIQEIQNFLRDIDRVVPVIQIEVIIVDVQNTKSLSTKIEAGLRGINRPTTGVVYPTQDLSLNSTSINNLISGINGLGLLNLGKVTPGFYFNFKALEEQGYLKIRSTPKIATLNGHVAKLSIGKTEFYLELTNNIIGTQNPQNVVSQQYKSINADLSITINPMVSGDDQITLDIAVRQSNFTSRISQSAPPGTTSRDFQSLIRMRNEEMIILGGLEENSTNESGSGLPLLSRIPILKWLFSSRTRAKTNNKLTIFIKPTVTY